MILAAMVVAYLVIVQFAKKAFYRWFKRSRTPMRADFAPGARAG
jgi:hypothetical protein